jgi:hypothetical protein
VKTSNLTTKLAFTIYGNPTQTDIVILNDSCHPHEHKISTINCLINRVNTYPVLKEAREKELSYKIHNKTITIIRS